MAGEDFALMRAARESKLAGCQLKSPGSQNGPRALLTTQVIDLVWTLPRYP